MSIAPVDSPVLARALEAGLLVAALPVLRALQLPHPSVAEVLAKTGVTRTRSYELSGGSIKHAVLRAAYRAAAQNETMTLKHFDDAAKRECQAAGKLYRVASREEPW